MADILIVDDDYDASAALSMLLRRSGHDVRHAPDGREALAEVVKAAPDLVVLDLRMPVMSGLDFLEVMRAYHRLSSVPVMLLTGNFDHEAGKQAARLGVEDVFVKGKDEWGNMVARIDQHFQQ